MLGTTKVLQLGLIGIGRWGQNYLRTIRNSSDIQLRRVAGRSHQYSLLEDDPGIKFTSDWREVCDDDSLDGVIVATTPSTHYDIVRRALNTGLPILVEKPLTCSLKGCEDLRDHSEHKKIFCMVNFIHIYSKGYQHLKSCLGPDNRIGHIFTENFAPGPYRHDVPVLWDWGSHDVAMCIDLLGEEPSHVEVKKSFTSTSNPLGKIFTIALSFPSGISATCTFGNGADFKRRCLAVVYDNGCLVYDGFSNGLAMNFSDHSERYADRLYVSQLSPLACSLNEFARCIRLGEKSHPSLSLAVSVHTALEAAMSINP